MIPVCCQNANPYVEMRKETYDMQIKYMENITLHQEAIMKDLENKLIQQRWQTNAIAILVFIMVLLGLFLSFMQFKADLQNKDKSSIEMQIGTGVLKFRSSVIGLALLIISFWFFHIYIKQVYNVSITEIPILDMTTFGVNS